MDKTVFSIPWWIHCATNSENQQDLGHSEGGNSNSSVPGGDAVSRAPICCPRACIYQPPGDACGHWAEPALLSLGPVCWAEAQGVSSPLSPPACHPSPTHYMQFVTSKPPWSLVFTHTVSLLHMNLQIAPFQRSKGVFACPITYITSRCLVYIVTCMHSLQAVGLLCVLLYVTVQSTVIRYLYFKSRMSESKHESMMYFSRYRTIRFNMI